MAVASMVARRRRLNIARLAARGARNIGIKLAASSSLFSYVVCLFIDVNIRYRGCYRQRRLRPNNNIIAMRKPAYNNNNLVSARHRRMWRHQSIASP